MKINQIMKIKTVFFTSVSFLLLAGCRTPSASVTGTEGQLSWMPAPVVIYKTSGDYSKLVPVSLNADKTTLEHYPHPEDLKQSSNFRFPTPLENGYLLDNKGVGPNTAFLSITYEEYCSGTPEPSTLMGFVAYPEPFVELWKCRIPADQTDKISFLNNLIGKNELAKYCTRVK